MRSSADIGSIPSIATQLMVRVVPGQKRSREPMSSGLKTQEGKLRVSHYGLSRREEQFFIFQMVTEDPAIPRSLHNPHRHATLLGSPSSLYLATGLLLVFLNVAPEEEVMADNPLEFPQAMREHAEQNMKQAHAAYEQLTDFVTKAMDAWMGAMPSPMAAGFKDVQGRAMQIAKENAEAAFTFAGELSNVRTPQEILTLQTQFAQDRMQAFATQTLELQSLIALVALGFKASAGKKA